MITIKAFRKMALGLDGAVEGAHMGHPDFRAFATVDGESLGEAMTLAWQNAAAAAPARARKARRSPR